MTQHIIASLGGNAIQLTTTFQSHGLAQLQPHCAAYQAELLDDAHLHDFLDLQTIGQQECLAAGTPHHIKPRQAHDLKAHNDASMAIISIRHIASGAHIGQALLTDPFSKAALNMAGYPLDAADRIIQSFYIHPQHRFSALPVDVRAVCHPAGLIFAAAALLAETQGAKRLLAKISDDNHKSIRSFERQGFDQNLGVSPDPVRGHLVRYVGLSLQPTVPVQALIQGARMDLSCPQ